MANEYTAFVVTEDQINKNDTKWENGPIPNDQFWKSYKDVLYQLQIESLSNSLEYLNNAACIKAYSTQIISDRRNVLLVTDASNITANGFLTTFDHYPSDYGSLHWMCGATPREEWCSARKALRQAGNWLVGEKAIKIKYCLSQRSIENCDLRINASVLIVVVICNLTKMLCMLRTWKLSMFDGSPLLTVGDAISFFLKDTDESTFGQCLLSRVEVKNRVQGEWKLRPKPTLWQPIHGLRRIAACPARVWSTAFLYVAPLSIGLIRTLTD